MFYDRTDAGKQLAQALIAYRNSKDTVLLAIPRGGVVIGCVLARMLHLPLDITLVKKLGHPANPEYAIGAVNLDSYLVDKEVKLPGGYLDKKVEEIQDLLWKRYELYYKEKKPLALQGKTVIIVDDGIATGSTLMACIKLVKRELPQEIVVAVPLAPPDVIRELQYEVDEVFCLKTPRPFKAVGLHYRNFEQVDDQEVQRLLQMLPG